MKRCKKCGLDKPLSRFPVVHNKRQKPCRRNTCQDCISAAGRKRREKLIAKNPDYYREEYQRRMASHKASARRWYVKNRAVAIERARLYRIKNLAKVKAHWKRWYSKNRQRVIDGVKKWQSGVGKSSHRASRRKWMKRAVREMRPIYIRRILKIKGLPITDSNINAAINLLLKRRTQKTLRLMDAAAKISKG